MKIVDHVGSLKGRDSRCRMVLKNGKRCRYRAKKRQLCGLHRKNLSIKRRVIENLILGGQMAAAANALVKFIEVIAPFVTKAAPWFYDKFTNTHFLFVAVRLDEKQPIENLEEKAMRPKRASGKYIFAVARHIETTKDYSELPFIAKSVFEAIPDDL